MTPSGYLLDTNVVSETRKREPNAGVIEFMRSLTSSRVFLSAVTIGELRRGVASRRRSDPVAAAALGQWVDELESRYRDQLLPVDLPIANRWGELMSPGGVPVTHALIGATAIEHGLAVVTRNVRDFACFDVELVDPWAGTAAPDEHGR